MHLSSVAGARRAGGQAMLAVLVLLAACGEPDPGGPDDGAQASATIDAEGGVLETEGIKVSIPAGALTEAVKISITVSDIGAPEVADRVRISRVYHVEPQRTKFLLPVTVTLAYEKEKVPPGIAEESADVRRMDFTRAHERLNGIIVSPSSSTASGETTNLGTFWSTVPAAPRPATIKVDPSNTTVAVGAKVAFTAEVKDQSERLMPGQKVVWSTSNAEVATIDENGEATAVGPGSVEIIARAGSAQGKATMQVAAVAPIPVSFGWENPRPQGNALYGVVGDGERLYLAGANGTLMERSENGWRRVASSVGTVLRGVAPREHDVFAVGVRGDRGVVIRWDGAQLSEQAFNNALPVAVYADDERGMAVGSGPDILLLDPQSGRWTASPGPTTEPLLAVDGSTGELHVVGSRGAVYKRTEAGAWIALHDNPLPQLQTKAVVRGAEAWAISDTHLRRFSDGAWRTVTLPDSPQLTLTALGATSGGAVLAGVTTAGAVHFLFEDGDDFKVVASPVPGRIEAIWGASSKDVYAVGQAGLLMHFDGEAWEVLRQGELANVADIAVFEGPEVFAVANECTTAACTFRRGVVMRRDAAGEWVKMPGTFSTELWGIGGKGPDELWAVGRSGSAFRWNGSSWTNSFASTNLNDVAVCGGVTYVAGDGQLLVESGGSFSPVVTAGTVPLRALACGQGKVYVVGDGAIVESMPGSARVLDTSADGIAAAVWRAVYVSPEGHVFVGGDARYIVHWNGQKFIAYDRPAGLNLSSIRAMWGTGIGDLYAVGSLVGGAGVVLHFNGAYWQPIDAGTSSGLNAVAGLGTGELWIGGDGGALLKAVMP